MATDHRALWSVAEIVLSHLRKNHGYTEPALVEGIERDIIHKISFQTTPKTILKYYLEFYLLSYNHYISHTPPRSGDVYLVET
jgi:hypothetical protein